MTRLETPGWLAMYDARRGYFRTKLGQRLQSLPLRASDRADSQLRRDRMGRYLAIQPSGFISVGRIPPLQYRNCGWYS